MNVRLPRRLGVVLVCIVLAPANLSLGAEQAKQSVSRNEKTTRSKSDTIVFRFAIYYLPTPKADPRPIIADAIEQKFKNLSVVEKPSRHLTSKLVLVDLIDAKDFPPPDERSLQYFGRSLEKRDAEMLKSSKQVLLLTFIHPRRMALEGLSTANALIELVANASGGLIWDDETRLMYSTAAWRETILASKGDIPNASDNITIHAYNTGEYARAITLGMAKFGFPDVVVQEFPWSRNRPVGNLINAFCQLLAEGTDFKCPGDFDLNLKSIKNDKLREENLGSLMENATGIARLQLRPGKAEEGDPDNDLIELSFGRYEGADAHAKQERALSELFGSADSAVNVSHDAKILAASKRAKAKLPGLRRDFIAGLRPNEYLLVKAPFEIPGGGNEWMWVEVIKWNGERIEGLLKNEPRDIPNLHGGQVVQVRQSEVFDYIRAFPDGRQEGNETGKIIAESRE